MRRRKDLAALLAQLSALLAVEVRHRLYGRRPARLANDNDRRESVIAGKVIAELLEEAEGLGAMLERANHILERRIAARHRVRGKPQAKNGSGFT